jgi:hypothetical protein
LRHTDFLTRAFQPRVRLAMIASCCFLALAGCTDDGTGLGLPTRISIAPADPVSLYAGDTLTVKATIINTPHTAVSYRSSNPAIAEVDALSGLVTAVAAGDATISAVSRIDPRVFVDLALTVLPDLPASLEVAALLDEDSAAADLSEVTGTLDLRLLVERGNARRLIVLLRDEVVCDESYPVPGSVPPPEVTFACLIDTAVYDESDGVPDFLNGAGSLSARLLASGDRVLAEIGEVDLVLTNASRIVALVQADRQALDASGSEWIAGDVTVQAQPVLYDPDAGVAWIAFAYQTPAGSDTTSTDGEAPFVITLPASGILADVTDADFRVALSSGNGSESEGPAGSTRSLRYDASPPNPGALVAREWFGAQTPIALAYASEGGWDAGVGRVHLRFYAGDPALSTAEIIAGGTRVSVGSDLPQSARQSYRLALEVCDILDNCTMVDGFLFGVDLTPPLVESFSIDDRAANPGTDLVLGLRDDLSGFADRPLEVSVNLLDGSDGTSSCGPMVEGIDLPGRTVGAGCAPDTLPNLIPIPRTTAGYYTYSIVASDSAGNRSSLIRRSILVDLAPPTLALLALPTSLIPGEEMSVGAQAADNLEIIAVDFRFVFPEVAGNAAIAIPLAGPVALGAEFDEVLTASATPTGTLTFVRTLTYGSGSPGPRPTVVVDSLRASARDAARLTTAAGWRIPREAFGNDTSTSDPYPRFHTAVTTADRISVCSAACGPGDPTSVRIAVRVDGESGTGRPFARLHFYRRGMDGDMSYLGSLAGTDATITNTGTQSSFVYSLEHGPSPGIEGDFNLVAVGVTSRGNALITATTSPGAPTITFYRR